MTEIPPPPPRRTPAHHRVDSAACRFNVETAKDALEGAMKSVPITDPNIMEELRTALASTKMALGRLLVEELS